MTEQPSAADVGSPPPEAVRRSLRSLAVGSDRAARDGDRSDRAVSTTVDPERTVREAEAAVSRADAAADFLAAGRLSELDAAVAAADRRGAAALAARGRDARQTLRRLRAAVLGGDGERSLSTEPAVSDTAAP